MTAADRRFPAGFFLQPFSTFLLVSLGIVFGLFAAPGAGIAGVHLLNPGEEMPLIAPVQPPPLTGANGQPLAAIKLAVSDGQSARLEGIAARSVPFEVVAPNAAPDLVWDPAGLKASAGTSVLAYKVNSNDLPAIIDRTAAVRALRELAAAKPQAIRVTPSGETRRRGEKVELDVENTASRALVLFNIAGDGTVQALYPLGSDPRVLDTRTYRLSVQIREPFGTDVIVAITANQPMERLDLGLRQISRFRSAGEALRLVLAAAPSDARVGLATLSSVP